MNRIFFNAAPASPSPCPTLMRPRASRLALWAALAAFVSLAGCAGGPRPDATRNLIDAQMDAAVDQRVQPKPPVDLTASLLPPLPAGVAVGSQAPEQRFDLSVSGASAAQVFMAVASGTPYSVLVPPEVTGTISVNLKNVTLREALDAIREMYGYDYRVQGSRIYVQPLALQTRVFHVNYLTSQRLGRSDTRVSSGSIIDRATGGAANNAAAGGSGQSPYGSPQLGQQSATATQVSTTTHIDFWEEIRRSIEAVIGASAAPADGSAPAAGGASVVTSPQAGLIIVRAMPRELRAVENFLHESRLTVERQVMLEAKIVEVVLSEGFQSGINWAAFTQFRNHRMSSGANLTQFQVPAPSVGVNQTGQIVTPYNTDAGTFVPNTLAGILPNAPFAGFQGRNPESALGSILGLAFQTNSFAMLLSFLETQGAVHVMSSPRIATLNNQKAVLKVGTDEYYVTNVTTTTSSSGTSSTVSPSVELQPFFSGIALDVTPQIDEAANIILHVRPSVSVVAEKTKTINLGSLGVMQLPLAVSSINETDSIVRVQDGNIVAIGGLMEQIQTDDSGKVPGVGDIPVASLFFKQGKKSLQKRELVVLIKPTVINSDKQWADDLSQTRDRLRDLSLPKPADGR